MSQFLRVTVADDNQGIRALIRAILQRQIPNCLVSSFSDGDAAFMQLEMEQPDLLITDHHMPRMNGIELVRKARGLYENLPIIMVSGMLGVDREAAKAGVSFLPKIDIPQKLLGTVQSMLPGSR